MVKYNKKFFFNEENAKPTREKPKKVKVVKEKKNKSDRKTVNFYGEKINYIFKKWFFVIILIVVLIILFLFIKGCSNNKNSKPKTSDEINNNEPVIVDSISINLYQDVPGLKDFVKNYDKVKGENDKIEYDVTNLVDKKYNSVGEYKVTITIKDKTYNSRIVVIDKEAPVFALKDVIINEGEFYAINDFISSCSDNSGKECAYDYENSEQGKITVPGTYTISIIASDLSGNKAKAQTATLTIKAKETPQKKTETTCKYGSGTYTGGKVLMSNLRKNNCAIDPAYARTETYMSEPAKKAKEDEQKLYNQIKDLNTKVSVKFDLVVEYVFNDEHTGLIGVSSTIKATNNDTNEVLVEYSINENGARVYKVNKLNIP